MTQYANGLHSLGHLMKTEHENLKNQRMLEEEEAQDYLDSLIKSDAQKVQKVGTDGRVTKERTWDDAQLIYIGNHIRQLRRASKMSQSEFEPVAKIRNAYCAQIEGGHYKSLDINDLIRIETALNANLKPMLAEVSKIKGTIPRVGGRGANGHTKAKEKTISAEPPRKLFERTKMYLEDFKGDDWRIQCEISSEAFELKISSSSHAPVTLKGNKNNYAFLFAMEEAVKMIKEEFNI